MEETRFKVQYEHAVGSWVIYRYHPASGRWLWQDIKLFRPFAVRYARKRAGKTAHLVLTKIDSDGTMELTYRRLTGG